MKGPCGLRRVRRTRTAGLEKARIEAEAHVKGMEAYTKDPGRQALEAEQLATLKRENAAKARAEVGTKADKAI